MKPEDSTLGAVPDGSERPAEFLSRFESPPKRAPWIAAQPAEEKSLCERDLGQYGAGR